VAVGRSTQRPRFNHLFRAAVIIRRSHGKNRQQDRGFRRRARASARHGGSEGARLGQRQQIAKTLEEIRDTATKLLDDLGHRAQAGVGRGRRAAISTGSAKRPKRRRTMSAEAREKIRQAQLKRWAKQKASERK